MNRFYKTTFTYCITLLCLLAGFSSYAEGSKDLYPTGATGQRAWLMCTSMPGATTWPFTALGTHFVYANVGEKVQAASSGQNVGAGRIRLTAPDGTVYNSANDDVGKIPNRAGELAGPTPNPGGYTPFSRTVGAGQAGIWKVEFIPTGDINANADNGGTIDATANWTQPADKNAIAAWDISVRNTANTAFITGRVYANVLNMYVTDGRYYGKIYVQTNDGYLYRVQNNGIAGIGFLAFVNNKGITNGTTDAALPAYKSANNTNSGTIKDPREPDGATSITQKMFYNLPNTDLPTSSVLPGGGITWLKMPATLPTISSISIDGVEGTANQVSSKGAYIKFNASQAGTFRVTLVGPPGFVTRKITGSAAAGPNSVFWDGKDGAGSRPGLGTASVVAHIQLQGGEVHFPLIDVEANASGMIIQQMDAAGTTVITDKVFWDDADLPVISGQIASSPITNGNDGTGISSSTNGHKWGKASTPPSASEFGNARIMDTWTYVLGNEETKTTSLVIQEADLQVLSITPSTTTIPVGQPLTYDVVVVNNGPSDVVGAPFKFVTPDGFVVNAADVTFTTSCATPHGGTIDGSGDYNATLDLPNGCIITYHVKGKADPSLAGTNIKNDIEASIMRPNDVTDPDATNPVATQLPTDPHVECLNGNTPPTRANEHCNNIAYPIAVAVTPVADIVTVKTTQTPGQTKYVPGGIVTYIITVTNNGANDASNVHIVDNAPAGCNITEWTLTSTGAPVPFSTPITGTGNLDMTVGTFPNGGQLTYVVKMKTPSNATTNLVNTATVTTPTSDPDPTCPACASTLTPDPQADIVTVKSSAVTEITPGGADVVYTITVTNNGPSDAKNVRVQDALPAGALSMGWSASSAITLPANSGSGNLDQTIPVLPNGGVVTYTVTVKTDPAFTGAHLVNTATESATTPDPDSGTPCTTCDVTIPVVPKADVTVVKSATVTEFTPGGANVEYTITVTNHGPSVARNVRIQDALPAGGASMTWSAGPTPITLPATSGSGDLDQTISAIPSGEVVTYTVTVVTDPAYTGAQMKNVVTENAVTSDPDPGNNCNPCEVDLNNNPKADIVTQKKLKDPSQTTFVPGEAVDYVITVTNNGPSDAKDVNIKDNAPAGTTISSWKATAVSGGANPPAGAGVGDIDEIIANFPNGAVVTYEVTVQTPASFTGNLTNVAAVTGTTPDPVPACPDCSAGPITPAPSADIVTQKKLKNPGQTTFVPGEAVDYVITVTNNGPSDAKDVNIKDNAPAGTTISSWKATAVSGGATPPAGAGVGNIDEIIANFPNGAVVTYEVTVQTPASFTGNLTNVAAVTSTTPDPVTACPDCSAGPVTPVPSADIVVEKKLKNASQTSFVPGEAVEYVITVTNNGPSDAQNVRIQDALPTGGTSMSWIAGATTITPPATSGSGNLDQTIPTLPNGEIVTYTVTVVTDPAFTGAQIKNVVTKNAITPDPTPGNDCNPCEVDLNSNPKANIVTQKKLKNPSQTTFVPGEAVDYVITVTNNGPSNAKDVNIKDNAPAGTTISSWNATAVSGGATPPNGTGTGNINETIANFPNSAVVTYEVTLQTSSSFTGNLTNVAAVTSTTPDPVPACPDCSAGPITAAPSADIVTQKKLKNPGQTTFVPGEAVDYVITVTNNGASDAKDVNIKDNAPAGTTISSWKATAVSGGATPPNGTGNGNINETIANFPNGAVVTYEVTVQTPASFTGNLTNVAAVTSTTPDPVPACPDCAADPITPAPSADIVTQKKLKNPGQTTFVPGEAVDYVITVTNNGPSDAKDVNIKDNAPAGTTISTWKATAVSGGATPPNGTGNGNINETIANFPNGAVVTYEVTVQTPASFTGTLTNIAAVTTTTPDPVTPCPDCAAPGIPAAPEADIVTEKKLKNPSQTTFVPGEAVDYVITVTNNGPSDAKDVNIKDNAPAGTTISSWKATAVSGGATPPNGTGNGNINETIANFPNGAIVTYEVTLQTSSSFTGNLTNVAAVTSTTPDPVPACPDCAAGPTPAAPSADIVTQKKLKDPSQTTFVPGGSVDYVITVTNNGPSDAKDVNIKDNAPAGTTISTWKATAVSGGATPPNGTGNGDINETIANFPNGAVVTYEVTVQIPASFTANLTNVAAVTSTTPDPVVTCPGCSAGPITPAPSADIVTQKKLKDPSQTTFVPGGSVDYVITVTNNGPSDAEDVNIKDNAPAGTTISSWKAIAVSGGATPPNGTGTGNIDETIANFPNGAVVTYEVTVQIPASFTTNLTNVAAVTSTTPDPVPACPDCAADPITPAPSADIVTQKKLKNPGQTTFVPGEAVDYVITVTNNGLSDAKDVNIKDNAPAGTTISTWKATAVSGGATPPNGTGNGNINETIANFPNGAVVTYEVTVQTPASFTGTLTNIAAVTSTTPDPVTPCPDCAAPGIPAAPEADIVTQKKLKNPSQTTFVAGEAVDYVITVTNNGPSDAKDVNIKDNAPAGTTISSWKATAVSGGATPPNGTGNGNINEIIASFPNGAVVTYEVTLQTSSSFTGNLTNVAAVTSTTPDPVPACPDCSAGPITAVTNADIVTQKKLKNPSQTTFVPGSSVDYVITVTNNGPSDAKDVNIKDNAPAGTTISTWKATAVSGGATPPNGTGTGNIDETIANFPNGAVVTYEVTVQIPASFTGNLTNVAAVTSTTPDPVPACPDCSAGPIQPGASADIVTVKKLKNPAQVNFVPGEAVNYVITVTNNGPSDAKDVTIKDVAPAGTTISSWKATAVSGGATPPNGTGNGNINETIANFPNAAVVTYEVTIQTPASFTGTLTNIAAVTSTTSDPVTPCPDCAAPGIPAAPEADIVTEKKLKNPAQTTFVPGETVDYVITVTNHGPSDAKDVNIKDNAPTGTTISSWKATAVSGGATPPNGTGTGNINETIASFPNGAVVTYEVTVKIPSSFTANLTNVAAVTSTTPDPVPACPDCAAGPITPAPSADIVTQKKLKNPGQTTFVPGEAVDYVITVTNNGSSDAKDVNIKDVAPAGTTISSWKATAVSGGATPLNGTGNGNIDETIANFPNGAVVTYEVTVQTPASFTGTLTNIAAVTSTTPDPVTPCPDCAAPGIPAAPEADIVTEKKLKDPAQTKFVPGEAVVYVITVTNHGPSDAKDVNVKDVAPAGTIISSWKATAISGGATPPNATGNGNINETIASFPNGAIVAYEVTVQTPASFTGALTNIAAVTSTTPDPVTPCPDCAAPGIPAVGVADIEIVKALKDPSQTSFTPGDPVTYTITVTNHGPSDAQNVRVQDAIPTGGTGMSWDATETGGVALPALHGLSALNQVIPTIPNGGVVTYTVTVTTDPAYTGAQMVNKAAETSDTEDPNGGDPCTTCEVPLDAKPSADVQIVKTLKNTTQLNYQPGAPVEYTITVTNHGPSDAKNVHIQDALPTGAKSMTWSVVETRGTVPGLVRSGNASLDQTIANLPDNAILTYSVTMQTDPAYTGTLKNIATETSTTPDPNSNNPCTTCDASVTPKPSADIVTVKKLKNAAQTTFNPGDDIEYLITVTNNGPSDAKNVRIQDALPAGAKSMSWSATQTGGATVPASGGTTPLDQTIATFPNRAVVTYNITMTTDPAFTGSQIINVAKEESETEDPNGDDPCTTCQTPLQSVVSADIVTVKKLKNAGQTTFKPGEAVDYVITVTNNGPSNAKNVRIQDALPVGASSMSWTVTSNPAIALPAKSGNGSLDQTIAAMPDGAVVTYEVSVKTPSSFTGNLVNVATETSETPDPNGTTPCAACSVNTPAAPSADLVTVKTTKTAGKTVFSPGEAVVYTITVTNNGPSDAKNVSVADNAPAGTTITQWTASVTPATVNLPNQSGTGNLNETIASLPDGAIVTYEVTVQTPPTFSGTLSNTAVVSSTTPDPVSGCTACVTTPLKNVPGADIVTVKALKNPAQTSFKPGDAVVYIITVTNNGPSDAANVSIADKAPDGTTISEWKGSATGLTLINTQGNGDLNETIANMPDGAVITYEVTVQTPITFKDDLVNTAVVNSTTPDPVSGCPACTAPAVPVQIVPPVAVDDAAETKANNEVTVPVLDNDNPGEGGGSPIVPTTVEVVDQPKHGTVKVNADGSVNYTPDAGYVGADSVTYRVQDEGGNWSNVATVRINVISNDLDIPNVITPNGDGNNDKFVIKGLERYQQNEIVIFNRWNNMIFRSKNYQNDWDGRGLNAGTYFYTLKVLDGNGQWQTRNGFITLMR
ncbi:gliding motility-associated C-terminal domain-containing protein [Chitinophaga agrisoli]|nr:gliding motility-associated C-terminal domain-containing protein [Chitinophaga agrisoli]